MGTGDLRFGPCRCNETVGFDHKAGTVHCRKCGDYWVGSTSMAPSSAPVVVDEGAPASVIGEAMLADSVRTSADAPTFPPRQADGTINPKDAAALKRVPMHLLPQVGVVYGAMACRDGAIKYGPYNWRERAISLSQYVGAMQRHLSALLDGEDCASDSKLPHLAHVIATAAILLDAQCAGALLDDRPKRSGGAAGLIGALNARLAAEAAK